jgi:4-hydroxybenzoyl-CoA thioesterase
MTTSPPAAIRSATPFVAQRRVRFGDCDPAGIVYYPRYFDMLNGVIEDWWSHIGLSWSAVLPARGIVTPVSHLTTQFLRPSSHGEMLNIALSMESLGRSSVRLALSVCGSDRQDERLLARARMVCVSALGRLPQAWPADIRATLANQRADPAPASPPATA